MIRIIGKKIDAENATVLPRGTLKINRVWREKNTGIRCSEREQNLPSGTRWRTAAASSSCCSNSSTATHYTAGGRYIRIHTRTSCRSVHYNNYNRSGPSGPGTLLSNRTRCLRNKNKNNCNNNTEQQQHRQQHYDRMYVYKTDFSIAQTTL